MAHAQKSVADLKDHGAAVKEEWQVPHSSELRSEALCFGIERFRRCICGSVYEEVKDLIFLGLYAVASRLYIPDARFGHTSGHHPCRRSLA